MPKKVIILIVAVLVILGGGIAFARSQNNDKTTTNTDSSDSSGSSSQNDNSSSSSEATTPPTTSPAPAATGNDDCPADDSPEIKYTAGGSFSPACVTIKAGATVRWENESNKPVQVGTDPHPSHTGNREVSGGEFTLNMAADSKATSTLTTPGEHSYHDHLNPSATGRIIVQ